MVPYDRGRKSCTAGTDSAFRRSLVDGPTGKGASSRGEGGGAGAAHAFGGSAKDSVSRQSLAASGRAVLEEIVEKRIAEGVMEQIAEVLVSQKEEQWVAVPKVVSRQNPAAR